MSSIIEMIQKVVRTEIQKVHIMELGTITSTFPHSEENDKDNYDCNVKLRDKDIELRKVPVATQHIGLSNPLHVGDLVLISFINGDFNSPVIIGRLYNDSDRPPLSKMEEVVYQPPYSKNDNLRRLNIILPDGIVNLNFQDNQMSLVIGRTSININSKGEVSMISKKDNQGNGFTMSIDNKSYSANIKNQDNLSGLSFSEEGSLTIITQKGIGTMSWATLENGEFFLNSGNDKGSVSFSTEGGKLTVNASKDIELVSGINFTVNPGGNMKIDCMGDLSIDATNITIKSKTSTNFESGGMMNIKGSVVNIN